MPLTEIKAIKKEFESPQFIHIYETKVMVVDFPIETYTILIKDKIINEGFRNYVNLLLKQAE